MKQVILRLQKTFSIIKKFLYSDHEIFLRELVSNAVDATQKLKTLASVGEYKGEVGDLTVHVKVDESAGTLTISDKGIGMTAEEIDKYINQIAFSSPMNFWINTRTTPMPLLGILDCGSFGFHGCQESEIVTKSYKEGSQAVKWSSDGVNPEYTIEDAEKQDRGTDIILYIDEEKQKFS